MCLQRAGNRDEHPANTTIIKVVPEQLPSTGCLQETQISTASAELVIHCGCVSMDINPQMSVAKIAELGVRPEQPCLINEIPNRSTIAACQ